MIQIPEFSQKSELFDWLRQNKRLLIEAKKSVVKFADAVSFQHFTIGQTGTIEKAAANTELLNLDEFPVKVVINTTNLFDSHGDVHIPGLWKKSLSELKTAYLLQEHQLKFDHVISDRVQPFTKSMSWKELGFETWEGKTQALIFDAMVEKVRNPFMAEQYAKGRVRNHSVGMRYIALYLAMNSESKYDQKEKEAWDKYFNQIVNKEEAEAQGYFFAVTEAKIIEGSAVIMGANFATPTISIGKELQTLTGADTVTPKEPLNVKSITEQIIINLKKN